MTANRKQTHTVIAVVLVLAIFGPLSASGFVRGFGVREVLVSTLALLPAAFVLGLVWFGAEVVSSLRRVEAAVRDDSVEPEFTRGS